MGKCFSRNKNKEDGEENGTSGDPSISPNKSKKKGENENLGSSSENRRLIGPTTKNDLNGSPVKRLDIENKLPGISITSESHGPATRDADIVATRTTAVKVTDVVISGGSSRDAGKIPNSPTKRLRASGSAPVTHSGQSLQQASSLQEPVIVSAAPYLRRIEFAKDYVGVEAPAATANSSSDVNKPDNSQQQQQQVSRSSSGGSGARARAALNAWMLPENLQSMYIWVTACGSDTEMERQALQHAFYGDDDAGNNNNSDDAEKGGSISRHIREQFGLDPCLIDWRLSLPAGEYEQVYRRTALPFLHELGQWKNHVVVVIFDSQRYSPLFDDEVRFVLDHFNHAQLFMIQRIFFNPPSASKPAHLRSAAEQIYFTFTNNGGGSNDNLSSTSNSVDASAEQQQQQTGGAAGSSVLSDAYQNAHAQLSEDLSRVVTIERQHVYRLKFDPTTSTNNTDGTMMRPTPHDDFMAPLLLACRKMAEKSAQFVLETIDEHQQPRNYSQISRRMYAHVFIHWYRMKTLLLSRLCRAHVVQNADAGFRDCAAMMQIKAYLLGTTPLKPPTLATQQSTTSAGGASSPVNTTTITTERRQSNFSPLKSTNSLMSTLLASSTAAIAAGTAGFSASSASNASHHYNRPLLVVPERLLSLLANKQSNAAAGGDAANNNKDQQLLAQSAQLAVEKRLCSFLLAETVQLHKYLLLLPHAMAGGGGAIHKQSPDETAAAGAGPRIVFRFRFNHRESLLELLWSVIEQIVTSYKLSNKVSVDIFLNLLLRERARTDATDSASLNDPYWPVRNALQEVLNQIALQLDGYSNASKHDENDDDDDFGGSSSSDGGTDGAAVRGVQPVIIIVLDNVPISVFAGIKLNSSRIRIILTPPLYAAMNEQHVHNYDDQFFAAAAASGGGGGALNLLQQYFFVLPVSMSSFSGGGGGIDQASLLAPTAAAGRGATSASLWSSQSISLTAAGSLPRETFSEALCNVYGLTQQHATAGGGMDAVMHAVGKAIVMMQSTTSKSSSSVEQQMKAKLRQLVLSSFASRLTLTLTLQELQHVVFEQQFHKCSSGKKKAATTPTTPEPMSSVLNWRQVNQLLLETLQQLEEQGFVVYTLSAWRDKLVYLLTDWSYDLLRRQQVVLPDAVDRAQQQHADVQRKSSTVSTTAEKKTSIVSSSSLENTHMPRSASSSSSSMPHIHRHKLTEVEIQILAAFAASIDRPTTSITTTTTKTSPFSLIIQLIQRLALECSSASVKQRGLSTTLMSNDSQLTVHFLMLAIEALVNLGQQNANNFRRMQQQKHKARRKSSVATLLLPTTSASATDAAELHKTMLPFCLASDEKLVLSAICCSLPTLASEPAQLAVQLYHRLNKLRITNAAATASSEHANTAKNNTLAIANVLLGRLEENETLSLPYLSQYDCLLDPALLYSDTATTSASGGAKSIHNVAGGGDTMYKRKYSVANLNAGAQQQQQALEFIKPSMIRTIPPNLSTNDDATTDVCRDLVMLMNEEKGCVAVYDYRRNRLIRQIYGIDRPKDVKFLDSDRCVILSNREMKIYSLKQGVQVGHLKGVMNQSLPYFAVQNEAFIVALSRNRMYVNMFDVESGSVKTTFKAGEDRFLNSLVVSRNGDKMVCGDETQKPFPLLVWDLNERKLIYDLRMANHEFLTQLMAIDDQGHFFACVCEEVNGPEPNFIVVYDIQHGTLYKKWKPGAPTTALAIASATKRVVVAAQNCGLYIYDLLAGSCKHVLFMHNYPATNLRVSDDGRRAVTWSTRENCLRVWDIMGGQYLGGFTPDEEISCAEINYDGSFVIFACQMYVNCYNVTAPAADGAANGLAACFAVSTNKQTLKNVEDLPPVQYGTGEQFIDLRTAAHKQLMEHGAESAV